MKSLMELYIDLQELLVDRDELQDKIDIIEKDILAVELKNYKNKGQQHDGKSD